MKPETELQDVRFVLEDFALETPGQQLLDRFLLGYPNDAGEIHRPSNRSVTACVLANDWADNFRGPRQKLGLHLKPTVEASVEGARSVVVVPRGNGSEPNPSLTRRVLEGLPRGARCFVHGVLAHTLADATALAEWAGTRGVELRSGTSVSVTWRLPDIHPPVGSRLTEGLIVVQGASPWAEMNALEGLAAWSERRRSAALAVRSVRRLMGKEVWQAFDNDPALEVLLASALS